jgi:hypothetical protein
MKARHSDLNLFSTESFTLTMSPFTYIRTLITEILFLLINGIKFRQHCLILICILEGRDQYAASPVAFVKIIDRHSLFQSQIESYFHRHCHLLYLSGKIYFLITPKFITVRR